MLQKKIWRITNTIVSIWGENMLNQVQSKPLTVVPSYNEPRYNEDPVITNKVWKPGRNTVKYLFIYLFIYSNSIAQMIKTKTKAKN